MIWDTTTNVRVIKVRRGRIVLEVPDEQGGMQRVTVREGDDLQINVRLTARKS